MLNFWAIKMSSLGLLYSQNYTAGRTQELSRIFILFWIPPKNSYLNHATRQPPPPPPPQNKIKIFKPKSKISNPKNSFDHPCHFKSGVPPLGLRHLCSIFTETGPNSPFSCARRALSKTAFNFLCQRKSYPVLYCRHSLIQGEILS